MAAGLVKLRSEGRIHVRSAGSEPGDQINPAVVQAMDEVGVDISEELPEASNRRGRASRRCRNLDCCGDACPIYPLKRYEMTIVYPAGQDIETVRRIRDEIDAHVHSLIAEVLD